jgi:phosphomevalonate kinase
MSERTTEEIKTIFDLANLSVNYINKLAALTSLDSEQKSEVARNVEHLEIIKQYVKEDGTSIWTSEYDFTEQDKAVILGKTLY